MRNQLHVTTHTVVFSHNIFHVSVEQSFINLSWSFIMSKPLKLYYDLMSQPARALYMFLKLNKIPHELCPVSIGKGETINLEI